MLKRMRKLFGSIVGGLAILLAAQAENTLPSGYERLEVVESTGSQYVDSGYKPLASSPFVVELTGCWTGDAQSGSNTHELFGVCYANDCRYDFGRTYTRSGTSNSWNLAARYSSEEAGQSEGMADTREHVFTANFATGVMTVDGETVLDWAVPATRNDARANFYLFARINSDGIKCHCRFRLRACRLLQGGVLVRDFVPAKRLSDGKVGLYDLVEGRFKEPNGTLTGHAYVPQLRLNYITSDRTQYINTGYKPLASTAFEVMMKGAWTGESHIENYELLGVCQNDNNRYDFGRTYNRNGTVNSWNLAGAFSLAGRADTQEHVFTANFSTGEMTVDSERVLTWSVPSSRAAASDSFYLFARRSYVGKSWTVNCQSRFRLRWCKFTQGETLVRDFVPGFDSVTGAAGVLDLANGGRHYPKGAGNEFAWGYGYLPKGDGESVYVGTLTAADMEPARDFEKEGYRSVSAAEVTAFPAALTLTRGELSFADGVTRTHDVAGALTLKGGAALAIDVAAAACDRFSAGSLVFDASVTAVDPVIVNVNDVAAQTALASGVQLPFLNVTGQTLTDDDAAKFRVKGFEAEVAAVDGALVLRAPSAVVSDWTGEANDGKWSTAGNWADGNVPRYGDSVRFNTSAGGALTMDLAGLAVASVTAGTDAGAFVQGGVETLAVESAITNASAAAQTFTLPMDLGASDAPFVFAATGDLTLTGGVKKAVSTCLVKTGDGVLHVNDETIAQATNVTVEAGVLRLERTGRVTSASVGGVIIVREGAQLDLHVDNGGTASLANNEVTHGKTLHIAGNGPAGSVGAIDNSLDSRWGCNFGRVILDADATVGGGWMSIRELPGSASTESTLEGPHTLTVRNEVLFLLFKAKVALDRLDLRGVLSFESTVSGAITNGIHCYAGSMLQFYSVSVPNAFPVTVEESGTILKCSSDYASTMAADLAIKPGVASAVQCFKTLTLTGALRNDGAVTQTEAGALVLAGAVSGGGTFAGERVRFSGAENRWEIALGDAATAVAMFDGVTDPSLFADLKTLAVRTTGSSAAIQTVDLGPAGNLTERQAAEIALAVTDAQDAAVPNCHLDVLGGRLVLTLRDANLVRTATWTGAGNDPTNLADPANWMCRNDSGATVEGAAALPGDHTVIEITAGSMFACPAEAQLTCQNVRFADGASLGENRDWSGLDLALILPGGTLDLAGNDLSVMAQADLGTAFTVTDSTATGGSLRIGVPENVTVLNSALNLTGSLRLVKTGAGTLDVRKFNQTYAGGTEVEAGTLTLQLSGSNSGAYSPKNRQFGPEGSEIKVDAGATLDTKGNYDFYQHPIVLNGGTLANTGCDMAKMVYDGYASIGSVTLLADSFFDFTYRTRFSQGVIDLGGHKLTARFESSYLHIDGEVGRYSMFSNGTLVVESTNAEKDGYFNPMYNSRKAVFVRDMRTVDLDLTAPLSIHVDIWVNDLTVRTTANMGVNAGKTCIYGVYTPVSGYMYNFVIENGATINLRDKTAAWSANPDSTLTACNTLAFAAGARVAVDLRGRRLRNGDCVISWAANKSPANVETVRFLPVGASGDLRARGDGVYYRTGLFVIVR